MLAGQLAWLVALAGAGASGLVHGLAGFGLGLVFLAIVPFAMPATTAVLVVTVQAVFFTVALFVPLRRDFTGASLPPLIAGSVAGTPVGVWALTVTPPATLARLIGVVLLLVVALEWLRLSPRRLQGRGWALAAGLGSGLMGAAVGTPAPPVVLYASAQPWSPRTMKANLQMFFVVNQVVIVAAYWWAGLLTREVLSLSAALAVPMLAGMLGGMALFARVDRGRFRAIVFMLLFVSGLALVLRR